MNVKQVSYKRTFNLGNYENIAVELVAEIQDGESPDQVLDELAKQTIEWKQKQRKS